MNILMRVFGNTTVRLLGAVILGVAIGHFANESVISFILPIKYVVGQLIFFLIPLVIIGFITPSLARMKKDASFLLSSALILTFVSCIGSASLATIVGYRVIPLFNITPVTTATRALPEMLFRLDIPPIMSILSALVFSFILGLSIVLVKVERIENAFNEFQSLVFVMVKRFLIPILPVFIATNFCILTYEGGFTSRLPVFIAILLTTLSCHIIWLSTLYISAGIYSGKNPWKVLKYYGPVALTAIGTQSSAASLGLAIEQTKRSPVLNNEIRDFAIPLLGNIHFPGSVLDVVFLSIAVSQLLYGSMPELEKILLFIPLLIVLSIAAPGLPGGTLITSLGLIHAILGIDDTGTALMISIFALLDSFGTTHNITADGALTLFLGTYVKRYKSKWKVTSE